MTLPGLTVAIPGLSARIWAPMDVRCAAVMPTAETTAAGMVKVSWSAREGVVPATTVPSALVTLETSTAPPWVMVTAKNWPVLNWIVKVEVGATSPGSTGGVLFAGWFAGAVGAAVATPVVAAVATAVEAVAATLATVAAAAPVRVEAAVETPLVEPEEEELTAAAAVMPAEPAEATAPAVEPEAAACVIAVAAWETVGLVEVAAARTAPAEEPLAALFMAVVALPPVATAVATAPVVAPEDAA